ncbi:putative FAD dependent oxidoreductase [Elsinoe ampelina]|uniref:Putative FAD dependent oxidoreductase n=1 Tax=Elsinoe ampelina TaxID=302913 RepID=A0A6A6GGW5_9PEZI|nr:putative FAD dependent oxidoreductase [Elsinoe ampelina]
MKTAILSAFIGAALCTPQGPDYSRMTSSGRAKATCEILRFTNRAATSFPNETAYDLDNNDYYSMASSLGPACVYAPSSNRDLSAAVLLLRATRAPFAVRSGGHMPVEGANGIGSDGVLLSMTNFTQLSLSQDKTSVRIGASTIWNQVYKLLEPEGLVVVGGRIGLPGVPGLVLGGGISFLGQQYGWAANNVLSFTCVLSDGRIVAASARQNPDLFWALKGGGNSFALVTELELRTYPSATVSVGQVEYGTGPDVRSKWISAIVHFAHNGPSDPRAAIIPNSGRNPRQPVEDYAAFRFLNGADPAPKILENFTAPFLPSVTNDTYRARSLYNWTLEIDPQLDAGLAGFRNRYTGLSIPADERALDITLQTFFQVLDESPIPSFPYYIASIIPMPMTKAYFQAAVDRGGDPMGLTPDDAPFLWVEMSETYTLPEQDAIVTKFVKDVDARIRGALKEAGFKENKYVYLNSADKWQDVFGGYKRENVDRLRRIRRRYDPEGLFTTQMRGGFKVGL